jgi:hypothetical protein
MMHARADAQQVWMQIVKKSGARVLALLFFTLLAVGLHPPSSTPRSPRGWNFRQPCRIQPPDMYVGHQICNMPWPTLSGVSFQLRRRWPQSHQRHRAAA